MEKTSIAYQAEMNKDLRAQGFMRVTFGLLDIDAAGDSKISASDHIYYSRITSLAKEDGIPAHTYATFEPNRMKADGSQLIPSRLFPIAQGYVSNSIGDENGDFENPPIIEIHFSKTHTVAALSFVFDKTTGEYPLIISVKAYRKGKIIGGYTSDVDRYDFVLRENIERFDGLDIIFTKTMPFHRARLQQIVFGMGIVFENATLHKFGMVSDIDPISRRLPTETVTFTAINMNGMYNPENPGGVWDAIEARSPIRAEYGQFIINGLTWEDMAAQTWEDAELTTWQTIYEGGITEWINCGRYLLDAKPSLDGDLISFTAKTALQGLDRQYVKGMYTGNPVSLYTLAEAVLLDAELEQFSEKLSPYYIDESLKSIFTVSPLPVKKQKECLQLIAHAACCILKTDRNGVIRIEKNNDREDNFMLNFETQLDNNKIDKIPTLKSVSVKAYGYVPKEESGIIFKSSYTVTAGESIQLSYNASTDIVITSSETEIEYIAYTAAAIVTFTQGGTTEIIVTAKLLEQQISEISLSVPNADPMGSIEVIENPLISDNLRALAVGEWERDYLRLRSSYSFPYRGNPELEANDNVYLQSKFSQKFKGRVLKQTLQFDTSLSGDLIMKRLEN